MTNTCCPALVITAPSSGSGKTTVVAAIARYFTNLGKQVRVFKTGPDFIDPAFLAIASKNPVYQLDFWMCGESHCTQLVAKAAQDADLILIEGVMGMFDGQCSSADIAARFDIPVLAVIDAGKMAHTFGAIAHGLATYRSDIKMFGVFANRVGSEAHSKMLSQSLPDNLEYFGFLPKNADISLPERHLGLVQAQELFDIEQRLDHLATLIGQSGNLTLPPSICFELQHDEHTAMPLQSVRIAIAKDNAFSFIYQANIELLRSMGAELYFFSPINRESLPNCDALYLPGGYPELYLEELAQNVELLNQVREHINLNKPVLAECGGMLFLNQSLTDSQGNRGELVGALHADSIMQTKLTALGLVEGLFTPIDSLRGHTFHYSKTISHEQILCNPVSQRGKVLDPVWVKGNVIASYVHWYFPSNAALVATLFRGELDSDVNAKVENGCPL
ncbi:cobyrinate a,c-diamide synthase [Vibrio sp. 10N.222.51.C12]|uniref:cobyrinate a,c-diamide synthase n=1 Tax=unclassified Vibrio TaxID=2614977 RepID=UPI000C83D0A2|nr:cobyrinate a,c-diamide synthase [Vibrio sp. 10N.286.48.B7]PMH77712.1 cobyrinic acid a,c-diamide synthase [Vibrio sp. 10N.286.48.B7]